VSRGGHWEYDSWIAFLLSPGLGANGQRSRSQRRYLESGRRIGKCVG
jgi:hypothetical protein